MTPPTVTVVGLGPAGPDLMTPATAAAIAAVPNRFLRTTRHPGAAAVPGATSFDHHYDAAVEIDDVYRAIVEDLVVAASAHGRVLYAVPGSPAVAERTVELLRADPRVVTEVLPALSCLDLAWARLGVDPLSEGVRIVDGHRFAVEAAGERGPLLVLQCDRPDVLADIKLAVDDLDPTARLNPTTRLDPTARLDPTTRLDPTARRPMVTVLQRLGLPAERVEAVAWDELDRVTPDHLTSLYIPQMAVPVGRELVRFDELVRTLRRRCPWDRDQTHASLRPFLLEEAYEVLEAIDALGTGPDDGWVHLEEELGDLLFQVFFHATLAAEGGQFTLADVARGIHDKLVRRHPHVFGAAEAGTAGQVVNTWEAIKRQERGRAGVMDGIPALPALVYAEKVQRRAAGVGFDWPDVEGAWPKVAEELAEVRAAAAAGDADAVEGELGDLLFACVNVARHLGVDAETALRGATAKFRDRFRELEGRAAVHGLALPGTDLATLDALWDEVKAGPAAHRSRP